MALDLGLGNEETIQSLPTEHERMDLRQTWWSVVILDIISSLSERPAAVLSALTDFFNSYRKSTPLEPADLHDRLTEVEVRDRLVARFDSVSHAV